MRILGIDPGFATIGFGVIGAERGSVQMLRYGAITTPAGLPSSSYSATMVFFSSMRLLLSFGRFRQVIRFSPSQLQDAFRASAAASSEKRGSIWASASFCGRRRTYPASRSSRMYPSIRRQEGITFFM